jgi:ABC-type phosphate transport system permease subunit
VPHAAKAALRTASTALTAGVANPFLSFAEDAATLVLFLVALILPVLVVALLLAAVILIVKRARHPRAAVRPA